ncbi:MAG: nickel-dependent hydrogenase large subunit [Anaerolineaceae bacterium]|nr:nickel-dependent hydrogenase large subunit [Anaerolineaceae bacterium]
MRAVEDALGIQIPTNARLIRNIIEAIQYIQDHVVHFYHLHALDWVDIVSALDADPAKTAALAQSISDWGKSSETYFKTMQDRIKLFVQSGQLGPFGNAYWGHPEYKLPAEANLMAVAHYLEALDWQREVIKAHAILGAKNPHLQTYLVGGMSIPVDPNSQAAINADKIAQLLSLFAKAKEFVEKVYLPDVLAVAPFYLEWAGLGEGLGNFLSYGDLPLIDGANPDNPGDLFFPRGVILGRDLSTVYPLDPTQITEHVKHSWFTYADESKGLHPSVGETTPNYTGPNPPYEFLNTEDKYSWLKAPRYGEESMEVGPLARMLIAYASGHERVQYWVDAVLTKLNVPATALFSTLGRVAARCVETVVLAEQLAPWTMELAENIGKGDLRIHENEHWHPSTWPAEAMGWGWSEAPRGALGHWIHIKDGKIANYQAIVPSTWNGSPRDSSGTPGAYEAALVGTPVADANMPVEILRTIHSFDPCMACAVHVLDAEGQEITRVTVMD